jgi:hypothetical protein
MSPTIRSLVIPVSNLDAAKAVYTALLGAPHTNTPTGRDAHRFRQACPVGSAIIQIPRFDRPRC